MPALITLTPALAVSGREGYRFCWPLHLRCTWSGLSESRRIERQRLAIRDSVKMSSLAIRRFGDSVIPRISGCQPDRVGARQGTTPELRRTSDTGYTSSLSQANILSSLACYSCSIFRCYSKNLSNKFLSGLICVVKEFP